MKVKSILSTWLHEDEHRFDCGPFVLGSIETRKILEHLRCRKDRLVDLTQGGMAGMYHVGQDKLQWVYAPESGLPFLRSADILKADLSNQPLISRQQVVQNRLFQCPLGTTLITRSGTIGRMAYCRQEMAEMAISQDVLKVVPDPDKVLSGYLYAFLSSKYGLPLVTGGTFGSIVVHIEAENIADLPVPRLSEEIESLAHHKVDSAARKRSYASDLLNVAQRELFLHLKMPVPTPAFKFGSPKIAEVNAERLQRRSDAFYFSAPNAEAWAAFDGSAFDKRPLHEVADVFIPGIFKRRYAPEPAFGYPYITGADVFELAPTTDQYLMRSVAETYDLVIREGMILVQEAGQLGGLIGRSVMVGRYLDGFACTNNMIRITPRNDEDTGYIFAVLASDYGVRLIAREAAGSSIPHIETSRIQNLTIPWPDRDIRLQIGAPAIEARNLRDSACDLEQQARDIVEQAIEGAA